MSKLITNVQYRVEWSYPSSPNAVDMGFSKTGCWTVERTATINGKLEEKPIRGYANRIEACAYVDTLLKCPTTDSIPSPATLGQTGDKDAGNGSRNAIASAPGHSPLPWLTKAADIYSEVTGRTIAFIPGVRCDEPATPDAQFIVRAVNAHDELVAACKIALDILGDNLECCVSEGCSEDEPCSFCQDANEAVRKLNSAIAKGQP